MYQCVLIDDEPLAIEVLRSYIEKAGLLQVANTFTNATKAFSFLEKNTVDLVFLDIQMPKFTGLGIIQQLSRKPTFILTTAYREFAFDGFELNALDFLVKPIGYDRFLKSLAKFLHTPLQEPKVTPPESRFIFIRENKRMTKIMLDEIIYLESQKDYMKIVTTTGSFVTRATMAYYEQWLSKTEFIRVHRSFLVAIARISSYTDEEIVMPGVTIPIGELYRKNFKLQLQKHYL